MILQDGNALEPDCRKPNSSPVQTWAATEIIKDINLKDKNHPIIQGVLNYLSSGKNFDGHTWSNTVATNSNYPLAVFIIILKKVYTTKKKYSGSI